MPEMTPTNRSTPSAHGGAEQREPNASTNDSCQGIDSGLAQDLTRGDMRTTGSHQGAQPMAAVDQVFSSQMVTALHQAAKRFDLTVYGKIGDSDDVKFLVLAGESHVKSPQAKRDGIALLRAFPMRFLEGVKLDRTTGDKILKICAYPYFMGLRLASLLSDRIPIIGIAGSTIDDAKKIQSERRPTTNIELEGQHPPSGKLNEVSKMLVATVMLGADLHLVRLAAQAVPSFTVSLVNFIDAILPFFDSISKLALSGAIYVQLCLKQQDGNPVLRAIYNSLNIGQRWILAGRNEDFKQTINRHTELKHGTDIYRDPALVIMGAAHCKGLGTLLERDGWQAVDLADVLGGANVARLLKERAASRSTSQEESALSEKVYERIESSLSFNKGNAIRASLRGGDSGFLKATDIVSNVMHLVGGAALLASGVGPLLIKDPHTFFPIAYGLPIAICSGLVGRLVASLSAFLRHDAKIDSELKQVCLSLMDCGSSDEIAAALGKLSYDHYRVLEMTVGNSGSTVERRAGLAMVAVLAPLESQHPRTLLGQPQHRKGGDIITPKMDISVEFFQSLLSSRIPQEEDTELANHAQAVRSMISSD